MKRWEKSAVGFGISCVAAVVVIVASVVLVGWFAEMVFGELYSHVTSSNEAYDDAYGHMAREIRDFHAQYVTPYPGNYPELELAWKEWVDARVEGKKVWEVNAAGHYYFAAEAMANTHPGMVAPSTLGLLKADARYLASAFQYRQIAAWNYNKTRSNIFGRLLGVFSKYPVEVEYFNRAEDYLFIRQLLELPR